jgi:hypothetical protein
LRKICGAATARSRTVNANLGTVTLLSIKL